jgi:hypothetical protein
MLDRPAKPSKDLRARETQAALGALMFGEEQDRPRLAKGTARVRSPERLTAALED